jgi:hypothetical protein
MTSLVSIFAICYLLYADWYMLCVICQSLYDEYHVLATASLQSYLSLYANLSTSCYMLYIKPRMPVIVYLYLYAGI